MLAAASPMSATTQAFYGITFEPAPPLLHGRVLRPMTVLEFTEVGEELLTAAQRTNCPYWLLDGRADRSRQQPELYQWLEDDYLPRVRLALGRPPIVAFLGTTLLWQQVQAQGTAAPDASLLSPAFRAQWFTDEAVAKGWLDTFRLDG